MSAPPTTPSSGEPPRDGPSESDAEPPESADPELARLRARVSELESELERKDHELHTVRRQYEALLQGRSDGRSGGMSWRNAAEQWTSDELSFACRPARDSDSQAEGDDSSDDGGLLSLFR